MHGLGMPPKKPLKVVYRRPRRTLVIVCGGQDVHCTGAAHLPVVAIITAGHGHSPLKVLFMPLVAAFDALLGAVSGYIGRCFLDAARCQLPASSCRAKHGHLTAAGALGGDAAWLLKRAPEEVIMSALPRALHVAFEQRAHATLASLAVNLWFATPSLPLPWRGMGQEFSRGDGANLIMDGIAMGLGRPVLGRTEMGVESDRRQQEHYASCMVAMA
jgi:hypothetical protein